MGYDRFCRGGYYVEVELQDGAGNLLDREVREFTLGVAAGEVTALKATPALFKIGNSIAVTLTFQNTGDVPITGTAYIQIAHTDGLTSTRVFTHAVTNLAAGNTLTVADVWVTTGMPDRRLRGSRLCQRCPASAGEQGDGDQHHGQGVSAADPALSTH